MGKPIGRIEPRRLRLERIEPRRPTRAYETTEGRRADKRFYASAAWIAARDLVRMQEPLCRVCLALGLYRLTQAIDHIIDRKRRPELALVRSNLQGLCKACHNGKRADRQ